MIFHLFGCECSGKIYVADDVATQVPGTLIWDVLEDFYKPNNIISQDGACIDWALYNKSTDILKDSLREFLEHCNKNDYDCILISTGLNQNINKVLEDFRPIIPIPLVVPMEEYIRDQAQIRNKDEWRVLEDARKWEMKLKNSKIPKHLNHQQAIKTIIKRLKNG